jgi:acyl carrier protein
MGQPTRFRPLGERRSKRRGICSWSSWRAQIRLLGVILETAVQDKGQLVEDIIEVIVKEGMVDRDKVQPDATIDSLDLKSIDIVMILTAIEEKFDVYIPMDGSFQDAKDVQGLIDAIAVHIMKEKEKENRANG